MPLLADAEALHETVERLGEFAEPREPDVVLGAEARGFILGAALAYRLGCGFVAARKPGKLPWRTISAKYALEYGFDALELHADAIKHGLEGPDPRRPPGHRRHRPGQDRPRRAARRHRRRPRVRDRARVPERPREARRLRRLFTHPVLGLNAVGVEERPPCRYIIQSPDVRPAHRALHLRVPGARRGQSPALALPRSRAPARCGEPRRLQGHVRLRLRLRARRARDPRRARLGAARGVGHAVPQPDDRARSSRPRWSCSTSRRGGSRRASGRGASSATRRSARGPSPRRPSACSAAAKRSSGSPSSARSARTPP